MKNQTLYPEFPPLFDGAKPVWGQGGKIMSLRLLASIPMFSLLEKGSKKRAQAEDKYWKQKDKEYNEIKSIYEGNCFVGTICRGNTDASIKITKIAILEDSAYVCYKASEQHIHDVAKMNLYLPKNHMQYKPVKGGKFSLVNFLSAIASKEITIISHPVIAGKFLRS